MHICIDIQSAVTQRAGVGRYTRTLVSNLGETAGDDQISLFYFDFKKKGDSFSYPNCKVKSVQWCPGRLAQLAWKTVGWPPFDFFAGKADLYHFPNFVLPPLRQGKSIATIHDMSFMRFPEFTESKNRKHLAAHIKHTAERADAITTVSNFSADEISILLGVERSRIFSVYHGISENFKVPSEEKKQTIMSQLSIDRPYLLTVGTVEPRKNIPFLIKLFEQMTSFDGTLIIAGMLGWKYKPILERIKNSPRAKDIRLIDYVDDDQLPSLYNGAELFLCSSFYEGFGFPPLESMACGTPVISSTGGSLMEVLGDGAVIIDDFDVEHWKTEAERILSDTQLRNELVIRGSKRAASYTWSNAAKETWKIYREVGS